MTVRQAAKDWSLLAWAVVGRMSRSLSRSRAPANSRRAARGDGAPVKALCQSGLRRQLLRLRRRVHIVVLAWVELARHLPEVNVFPRAADDDATGIVAEIVGHSTVGPNGMRQCLIYFGVVPQEHVVIDLQRGGLRHQQLPDRLHDVAGLELGGEDRATAVASEGVGPIDDKEVRKVRDRHADVRAGVIAAPLLTQRLTRPSDDVHRPQELQDLEAGRERDNIRSYLGPR